MTKKTGVGRSNEQDAFTAGAAAARSALLEAGVERCDFILMFATVGFNQTELLKGVRSVTGDTPLSGCSGEGVITQAGPEGETIFLLSGSKAGTDTVGVMAITTDGFQIENCVERGVKENSRKAGEEIGRKINAHEQVHPVALWVLADGFKTNVKEFLEGINATTNVYVPCIGAMSGDNFILGNTYQYFNDEVVSDSVTCILICGDIKIEFGVTHGCIPIGLEKKITKAKGNTVITIENQTAWAFFKQYLDEKWTKFTREIRTFLDFAIKLPEDLATEYDRYIIRAPMGQNSDDSMIFSTEIPEGTYVQVIRRDIDKTSLGAKAMAQRIKARLAGRTPVAIFHIDCAARGRMFFLDAVKEKGIDVMQDVFGKETPWLGLYACGEIAPIKNINYFHNQTAILCVLYK